MIERVRREAEPALCCGAHGRAIRGVAALGAGQAVVDLAVRGDVGGPGDGRAGGGYAGRLDVGDGRRPAGGEGVVAAVFERRRGIVLAEITR